MRYKALFDQGIEFQTYLAQGSEEEVLAVVTAADSLVSQLTSELAGKLTQLEHDINILIAGETWCPDCQLNITAIRAMAELQPKIKVSIISRDFAQENLLDKLDITEVKIPLAVVLDQYYELKGLFIEQPKTVKLSQSDEVKAAYNKGDRLSDTITEILDIIQA
jgi:hypothetical protein